ncbi:hypothetical protein GCM10029978_067550 [Actinoallomurus acanthiterrae]
MLFAVISGLLINECCDLCPWLADKLVRWSARLRCADPAEAEVMAEDLATYIVNRPGKLFKLLVAFGFVGAGLARRARRSQATDAFLDRRITWEASFRGFCVAASLVCVLLMFHGFGAFLSWLMAVSALSWVSARIEKLQAKGRVSRLERPYVLGLVLLLVPGVYLCCLGTAIVTAIGVFAGHQSIGIWIGLIFNLLMLPAPISWLTTARAQRRLQHATVQRPQAR